MIKIINNDCLIALKEMESNSVDSVVTDPPYGLSFMNKHWDYDVPSVDIWKEVIRVLKPGGHLLSFGGTRTYHRMVVNIEDAGFEIRDQIQWLYGSGFPKSLDVAKAIEGKLLIGSSNTRDQKKLNGNTYDISCGQGGFDTQSGYRETAYQRQKTDVNFTTKEAIAWEGWGTALKPANEPICLARKPLSEKTVAENVLKWGTGGINIDGCRVKWDEKGLQGDQNRRQFPRTDITGAQFHASCGGDNTGKYIGDTNSPAGRFPANVIHDGSEEVVSNFPNGGAVAPVKKGQNGESRGIYGDFAEKGDDGASFHNDGLGSASRFFYCAKASKSERNKGLEDFEEKRETDRENDSIDLANRLHNKTNRLNHHPTVKPISLMQYLCRLITPQNGIVLDPFMGSGSTGIGAKTEGFNFIGIEREEEYCKIVQARINAWEGKEPSEPPKPKIVELTLWNQC